MDEYYSFVAKIKAAKEKTTSKSPQEYQRLRRYDVIQIGNDERLFTPSKNKKRPNLFYTFMEENFEIIHETHIAIGHGGRNKMMSELKSKYKNITSQIVMIYLNLCEACRQKNRNRNIFITP